MVSMVSYYLPLPSERINPKKKNTIIHGHCITPHIAIMVKSNTKSPKRIYPKTGITLNIFSLVVNGSSIYGVVSMLSSIVSVCIGWCIASMYSERVSMVLFFINDKWFHITFILICRTNLVRTRTKDKDNAYKK